MQKFHANINQIINLKKSIKIWNDKTIWERRVHSIAQIALVTSTIYIHACVREHKGGDGPHNQLL